MKQKVLKIFSAGLAVAVAACGLAGCRRENPGISQISQAPSESRLDVDSSATDIDFDVQAGWYWDWNDLHDYFECTDRSGDAGFDSSAGESVRLYAADGETECTDWNEMITDGMVAVKYAADGTVINRFLIRLAGEGIKRDSSADSADTSGDTAASDDASVQSTANTVSGSSGESDGSSTENAISSTVYSAPAQDGDTVTALRVLALTGSAFAEQAATDFQAKNPHVSIILERANFDENTNVVNYLKSVKGSDKYPNVIFAGSTDIAVAGSRGLLSDLTDYGAGELSEQFTTACFDAMRVGGKLYGLPMDCATDCLVANTDVMNTCSQEIPASFNELLKTSARIKSSLSGIMPFGLAVDASDKTSLYAGFAALLWSAGGSLVDDGGQTAFASDAGVSAVESIVKLERNAYVSKDWKATDLYNGKTALAVASCKSYALLFGSDAKCNFSAAPLFGAGDGVNGNTALELNGCAVTRSDEPEDALAEVASEFAQFCAGNEKYQLAAARQNSTIPSLLAAQKDSSFASDEWKCYISALETARVAPQVGGSCVIRRYIADAVLAVSDETATPADALSAAAEKVNARLARNAS